MGVGASVIRKDDEFPTIPVCIVGYRESPTIITGHSRRCRVRERQAYCVPCRVFYIDSQGNRSKCCRRGNATKLYRNVSGISSPGVPKIEVDRYRWVEIGTDRDRSR